MKYVLLFLLELYNVLGRDYFIHVKNCVNSTEANAYGWSRGVKFVMLAYNDENPYLNFKWLVVKMSNVTVRHRVHKTIYSKGSQFTIEPYTLHQGFYRIEVSSNQYPHLKMLDQCFIRIKPEKCFAAIAGGSVKHYRPSEQIVVNGGVSIDYCYAMDEPNSLQYTWNCKQKKGVGFCTHSVTSKESTFLIPKEHVVDEEEFVITLIVKNEDGFVSETTQKIIIKENVVHYEMRCVENCPPWSRAGKKVKLVVDCMKYCPISCDSTWDVYKNAEHTHGPFTKNSSEYALFVAAPGKIEFTYKCEGNELKGYAAMQIEFKSEPNLVCSIYPQQGRSISTLFRIFCKLNSEEDIEMIDVFTVGASENGIGEFITNWFPPNNQPFRLSSNIAKVVVRASVHPELYSFTLLDVNVIEEFASDDIPDAIRKIIHIYKGNGEDSILHYLEYNRHRVEALSMINSLWNEINALKKRNDETLRKFLYDFRLTIIDDLLMIPVTTTNALAQMNNIIQKLLISHSKSDPYMDKSLSILCKDFASEYEIMMKYKKDLYFKQTMVDINIVKTFAECLNKTINENFGLLQPIAPFPKKRLMSRTLRVINIIEEEYEDYKEFGDNYYKALEDLEEGSSNLLEMTRVMAASLKDDMGASGRTSIIVSDVVNISVFRKPATYYHKSIGTGGVWVYPSSDILRSEQEFSLEMVSWRKNIFWWSESKFKADTLIADISLVNMESNKKITEFLAPNYITFSLLNDVAARNTLSAAVVPADFITAFSKALDDSDLFDSIDVHRIDVFDHQGILVQFHDLEGKKFLVVVNNFKLPVISDFKKTGVIIIDENNTYAGFGNNNEFDAWYYVGILPHLDMAARSNSTHIVCSCRHLSILAGKLEPLKSRKINSFVVPVTVFDFPFKSQWEIFWCVLSMFIAFCIVLLLAGRQRGLYYAIDNQYDERYAYLIVVRTGRHWKTTSHIVIRITGTEGRTPPHILNYPDPSHKIFTKDSEDWIVITTAVSLGIIESIELWHDNYGIKPDWYCKDITIHDVQTREKVLFKVNSTISVCHQYRINIIPFSKVQMQSNKISQNLDLAAERNMWNIFHDDIHYLTTLGQRLIVFYSKLLVLFVIVLIWHGLPKMRDSDSIEPYGHYIDLQLLSISFSSSIISFLFHTILTYPRWKYTVHVAISSVSISNLLLIIFGFWVPQVSSFRIIIGWLFGLLFDFIFTKLLTMLRKLTHGSRLVETNKGISFGKIKETIDVQRETLHEKYEGVFDNVLDEMKVPFRGKKMKRRQREDTRRSELVQQLKDLVMFGIYYILLHAFVTIEKDHLVFRSYNVLQAEFKGELTRTFIREGYGSSLREIHDHLKQTIVKVLHSEEWYPNYVDDDPRLMYDRSNKFIGVARFRQLRVIPRKCRSELVPHITLCGPEFSEADRDHRKFEDSWKKPTSYIPIDKRMSSMWIYSHSIHTGSESYRGRFANYPGGGYVMNLGKTKFNALTNIAVVTNTSWIDRFTRTIFMELLTYSANYNLFNSINIVTERAASGLLHTRLDVVPARMIFAGNELEKRNLMITVSFLVWLILFFLHKTRSILRDLEKLKNFWNLLDLTIMFISVCTIIIYILRIQSIGHFLRTIENVTSNVFINYLNLFVIHRVLSIIGAVLVCLSTFRLWKLLRFFKMLRIFEKTFLLVVSPLMALFVHHLILAVACVLVTRLIIGSWFNDFVTYGEAFKSLLRVYLNNYQNYKTFYRSSHTLDTACIVVYIIASKAFLFSYTAIALVAYLESTAFFSKHHENNYSFIDYVKEELMFFFIWFKPRITHYKAPMPKRRLVYPKTDKFLYGKCVSTLTHRMKSMQAITAVLLREKLYPGESIDGMSDEKFQLMLLAFYYSSEHLHSDQKELFYKVRRGSMLKFVDWKRVHREKEITEVFLETSKGLEMRQKLNRRIILRRNVRDMDKALTRLEGCMQALADVELVNERKNK